jgi:hypothetical protein
MPLHWRPLPCDTDGWSTEQQLRLCREHAAKLGVDVVAEYEDRVR